MCKVGGHMSIYVCKYVYSVVALGVHALRAVGEWEHI